MAFKKNNPGCPCCTVDCDTTCFKATGCLVPAEGATVEVFATGTPGTVLYSGTLDVNGEWCVDLTAHAGTSLSVTISYGGDFQDLTEILLGNPCGRTYEFVLTPVPTAGGGGVAGTINVNVVWCGFGPQPDTDIQILGVNTPPTPNTLLASCTVDSLGNCTFTGIPTGIDIAIFVRMTILGIPYSRTYATWQLECEADVAIVHDAQSVCSSSQTITQIGCGESEEQHCCVTCTPELLPHSLCLTDECAGTSTSTGSDGFNARLCGACESADTTLEYEDSQGITCEFFNNGPGWWGVYQEQDLPGHPFPIGASYIEYRLICEVDHPTLQIRHTVLCQAQDAYGRWKLCRGSNAGTVDSPCWTDLPAESFTCDPFTATFEMPEFTINCTGFPLETNFTRTIPARTITVVEGPCS